MLREREEELLSNFYAGALADFADAAAAELATAAAAAAAEGQQRPTPHTPPAPSPRVSCPAEGCSKTYASASGLASHVSDKHPGLLSERQLANCALGQCPAEGCGRVFSLLPSGKNPRSGLHSSASTRAPSTSSASSRTSGRRTSSLARATACRS